MTRTCGNCLNAYNSPWRTMPQCWNKEWLAQFGGTDTAVRPDESCGTWQRSVRTLILENRWPEEEYISDIDFMNP